MALTAQGVVWTWGWNSFGQLGTATTTARLLPIQVLHVGRVVALAPGCEALHRLVLLALPTAANRPRSARQHGPRPHIAAPAAPVAYLR